MNPRDRGDAMGCEEARLRIPDVAASRAPAADVLDLERHTATCADCRTELALVRVLFGSRERSPEDVTAGVLAALRRDRRPVRRPWWGISAAAVAALALGIGIVSNGDIDDFDAFAVELVGDEDDGELWLADDAVLAGAPVLDELSDEVLMELLDALTSEVAGGQA